MTSQDHDTDPSTPGAKRFSDPRTPAAAPVGIVEGGEGPPVSGMRHARFHTDPGVAPPPSEPRLATPRPPPVVVPPVAVAGNDSVDILLEGISGEQPDRPRTTPQTDGQAAATYHAQHALRAARTSPDDEPKVVIDRPPLADTIRLERVPGVEPDERTWTDTTAVSSQPMAGRVVVAIVAGLAVVAVIFFALQRTGHWTTLALAPRPAEAKTLALAPAPAPAPKVPSSGWVPVPTPGESTSAAAALDTDTGNEGAAQPASRKVSLAPSRPVPASPVKPRAKSASSTPKPKSGDLGEFKATF